MILLMPFNDFVNACYWFQNVGNKDIHDLYVCITKFKDTTSYSFCITNYFVNIG